MSIIAEKLRQAYHNDLTDCPILLDAADELVRLEQERDALREALKLISNYYDTTDKLRELARAALGWEKP